MKVTINTTEQQSREMYNLSDLIKTDCCIDCGTNEKLREVVGKIGVPANAVQEAMPIENCDTRLMVKKGTYATFSELFGDNPIPITQINIDL